MRAREWAIAGNFGTPAEYDIPDLPTWHVCHRESGGLALAAGDDSEAFIAADQPVVVRR